MGNGEEGRPRDRWSKAEILMGAIASVLLPMVVALIGGTYTYLQDKHNDEALQRQQENELIKQRSLQAVGLLGHLASENARERLLAVKVAEQLAKDKLLPSELVPALLEIAKVDPSSAVSVAAAEVFENTSKVTTVGTDGKPKQVDSQAKDTFAKIPPRVYIHIRSELQKKTAERIAAALQAEGFLVPGIERLEVGPKETELRYFSGSQQADTASLVEALRKAGISATLVDLTQRYPNSKGLRPRHYELWVSAGAL